MVKLFPAQRCDDKRIQSMETYQVFDNKQVYIFASSPMQENQNSTTEWFASWFDSPYYPMLYRHRNEIEAREFLHKLHDFLKLPEHAAILDLACGQGRHSRTLHGLGYRVFGVDLSPASISVARELASPGQQFEIADMRSVELAEKFDAVFNLFTSFGYFSNEADNISVLSRVHHHLKTDGIFVLDYLNAYPLLNRPEEVQSTLIDGVEFQTRKHREGKCVVKDITIHTGERELYFSERVQLFTREDLTSMLGQNGFTVEQVFGSYGLDAFQPAISPRCLIIARKS
jgi:SAM-dependent methyltransferase